MSHGISCVNEFLITRETKNKNKFAYDDDHHQRKQTELK